MHLFLKVYLEIAEIKLNESLKERINNYYSWTAIRTATLYLLSSEPQIEEAEALLLEIQKNKGVI